MQHPPAQPSDEERQKAESAERKAAMRKEIAKLEEKIEEAKLKNQLAENKRKLEEEVQGSLNGSNLKGSPSGSKSEGSPSGSNQSTEPLPKGITSDEGVSSNRNNPPLKPSGYGTWDQTYASALTHPPLPATSGSGCDGKAQPLMNFPQQTLPKPDGPGLAVSRHSTNASASGTSNAPGFARVATLKDLLEILENADQSTDAILARKIPLTFIDALEIFKEHIKDDEKFIDSLPGRSMLYPSKYGHKLQQCVPFCIHMI
jgi:hypothetical protein